MKRSVDRILTTHTGSLPRPDRPDPHDVRARRRACRSTGRALAARIRAAVAEVVRKQVDAGIAVVNDGEVSKPSYATYVKDRLTGFGGTSQSAHSTATCVDFPEMAKRVFGDPGRSRRKTPACTGPIGVRDPRGGPGRRRQPQGGASAAVDAEDVFMSAASPGVISLFFRDDHYRSHEAYLFAIADAMRHEYETVARAGFILQLDCPDLAMGRHIQFADARASTSSARWRACTSRRSTTRWPDIPPEQLRMHLCWGNYEGPHHHDVPLADILDLVFAARPQARLLRGRQPPPRARVEGLRARSKLPDGQDPHPGRARLDDELHRAPGAGRRAHRPLRAAGRPRERHRRHRLRLRHLGRPGRGRSRHRLGEAGQPGRGRAARLAGVLVELSIQKGADGFLVTP